MKSQENNGKKKNMLIDLRIILEVREKIKGIERIEADKIKEITRKRLKELEMAPWPWRSGAMV